MPSRAFAMGPRLALSGTMDPSCRRMAVLPCAELQLEPSRIWDGLDLVTAY